MYVDNIPTELASLEKLEQILVAQRIVFEKIIVMPKGQQRKVKGAICNVPVECDETCKVLPWPPERSGIIMLKLKRKLEFRGHVYFQAVHPEFIVDALIWLKMNKVEYFNARLLHYSGRFATNPEYLFFAQFITEQKKVSDSIAIKTSMANLLLHHKNNQM